MRVGVGVVVAGITTIVGLAIVTVPEAGTTALNGSGIGVVATAVVVRVRPRVKTPERTGTA